VAATRASGFGPCLDQVARPVAQQRRSRPAQVCQHQLSRYSAGNALPALRVDHFGDVSGFDHVQRARASRTAVAHRTDLRHAVVVYHLRAVPEPREMVSRSRDAAARLSGHNDRPHSGLSQVDLLFAGDLRQAHGIGRGAAQHGRARIDHGVQTRRAAHAAAGHREITQAGGCFKGRPESKKRPEREGKEQAVPRPYSAASNTLDQLPSTQSQLSGVSSQRMGCPDVPLVWQKRV